MSLLSFEAYKRWFPIITDVVCSYLLFPFVFLNAIFCARIGCFKVGISQFLLQEEPPNNSKTRCGLGSTDKRSFHSGCLCRPRTLHALHNADGRLLEDRETSQMFPSCFFSPRGLLTALTFTLSFLLSSLSSGVSNVGLCFETLHARSFLFWFCVII